MVSLCTGFSIALGTDNILCLALKHSPHCLIYVMFHTVSVMCLDLHLNFLEWKHHLNSTSMPQYRPFRLQLHMTEEFLHLIVYDVMCIALVLIAMVRVELIANLHLVVW